MYFRASEHETACSFCDHPIGAGSLCISLAPIDHQHAEPADATEFAVLHVECEKCETDDSCFVRYASRQSPTAAETEGVCAYCQHEFETGQPILLETILVTDADAEESTDTQEPETQTQAEEMGQGSVASRWGKRGLGMARQAGGGVLAAAKSVPSRVPGSFKDLSPALQRTIAKAGRRGSSNARSALQAEKFYQSSIPRAVRNLGKTKEFLVGKDGSHIESIKNAPHKARLDSNLRWESQAANQLRGSNNMTRFELIRVNARNAADASRIVGRQMAGSAARAGIFAALIEAPISATENFIHFKKGKKTGPEAAKTVAGDTVKAGAVGAAVGAGMVVVVAVGGGAVLAPIAIPLAVAGGSVYTLSSILRIRNALAHEANDQSTHEAAMVVLAFHVECTECESGELCHDGFLKNVVAASAA